MANTLHENMDGRRQVVHGFGAAQVRFTIHEGEAVGKLEAMMREWMVQCGQGDQWKLDRGLPEVVDFGYCYPILPIRQIEEVIIFSKEVHLKVKKDASWLSISDQIVQHLCFPRGTLFRIYPVDMDIQRIDEEDTSYSFDWVDQARYWFEVVHDRSRDGHDLCRQIRMVDFAGRVESIVVPGRANIQDIRDLWKRLIDCPDEVWVNCNSHNAQEYYWGFGEGSTAPNRMQWFMTGQTR
jgi:hypothetical protein